MRARGEGSWASLERAARGEIDDDCRVVVAPDGHVGGYAWRGRHFWSVSWVLEKWHPDALVLAEAVAEGPAAADAVLALCSSWATEEARLRGKQVTSVLLALPVECPLAEAARHRCARFVAEHARCGGSMARVLDTRRLLISLLPELTARLQASGEPPGPPLAVRTETGDATLAFSAEAVTLLDAHPPSALVADLPQQTLARLALGTFEPRDLLARLDCQLDPEEAKALCTLFPCRHPHMYLPDRY